MPLNLPDSIRLFLPGILVGSSLSSGSVPLDFSAIAGECEGEGVGWVGGEYEIRYHGIRR